MWQSKSHEGAMFGRIAIRMMYQDSNLLEVPECGSCTVRSPTNNELLLVGWDDHIVSDLGEVQTEKYHFCFGV